MWNMTDLRTYAPELKARVFTSLPDPQSLHEVFRNERDLDMFLAMVLNLIQLQLPYIKRTDFEIEHGMHSQIYVSYHHDLLLQVVHQLRVDEEKEDSWKEDDFVFLEGTHETVEDGAQRLKEFYEKRDWITHAYTEETKIQKL